MFWTPWGLRRQRDGFLVIATPACFILAGYTQQRQMTLDRYVPVAATIVSTTPTKDDCLARFTMTVDGKEEQGSVALFSTRRSGATEACRRDYPAGKTVRVFYDPTGPAGARPASSGTRVAIAPWTFVLAGLVSLGIGLLFRRAYARRRHEDVLR